MHNLWDSVYTTRHDVILIQGGVLGSFQSICWIFTSLWVNSMMVRVAFVHPDLGIGGAERLVVDAGLALKSRGHEVHFFTSHHDKSHCFEETKNGSLQVTAVGDWLPRHCFGYFYAFWAYVRMIYVSIYLVFFSSWRMDVVFCDQVSVCIPFLKLSKARIVFYCHFPDLLLTQRKSFLKKLYRAPLDWLEELTTGKLKCDLHVWRIIKKALSMCLVLRVRGC